MAVGDRADQANELPQSFLTKDAFRELFGVLAACGYTIVGPRVDQEAIVYGELESPDDLPIGWTDEQAPGEYRLKKREDEKTFGFAVGPHSWKQFLFPPQSRLLTANKEDGTWQFTNNDEPPPRYAFLGVRACELAAIHVQDRVFMGDNYVDPIYAARRTGALLIAVNCTEAAPTCFCTSMNTGPRCSGGYDLVLTELDDGYVLEAGTQVGAEILSELETTTATETHLASAETARQEAIDQIERRFNTDDIRDLLLNNLDHHQWDDVAERCLSCTNCTMVCPTCFCSSVEQVSDLTVEEVEHQRVWDSCFNFDFSYMHGGGIRGTIRSRYRQWLTHKLGSWIDQFGTSGCVGCGRCITWCPVGIDLTQEVDAIRKSPKEPTGPQPDETL